MKDPDRPWVIGVSSSHNGAVCLLHGEEIVVAIQEERLLRKKRAGHPAGCASLALEYCLDYAGIAPRDLSAVGVCVREWQGSIDDVSLNPRLQTVANEIRVVPVGHHLGHAIGAFATSGYEEAAVLVVDGSGSPCPKLPTEELDAILPTQRARHDLNDDRVRETMSLYEASGTSVHALEKHVALRPPGFVSERMAPFFSLGRLFECVGAQIFGSRLDGPGKVMGLAPFGRATIPVEEFFEIVDGDMVFRDRVPNRFAHAERWPQHQEAYADLAASTQAAFEHALLWIARRLRERTTGSRLCYAGGVALNSVANERLVREGGFDDVFIMPAAEDSGTAIGAAYRALWELAPHLTGRPLTHDSVGRRYAGRDVDEALRRHSVLVHQRPEAVAIRAAEMLADGQILGWFDGGSELGPRALGQRSILADARRADMKDRLNLRVKFREMFRPYAPAVLAEHAHEWFEMERGSESAFMLRVFPVRPVQCARIPAVVHVDGTARIQTVSASRAPRFHALLTAFHARTGVPVLLNTSFNTAGDPIVETPDEAMSVLAFTELDACVIDGVFVTKPPDWRSPLDLCPTLQSRWVAMERAVTKRGLRRKPLNRAPRVMTAACVGQSALFYDWADRAGVDHVRIVVDGRYGRIVHAATAEVLPILQAIDGRRTGWAILDRVNRRQQRVTETSLLALFRSLSAAGIIGLRRAPSIGRARRQVSAEANGVASTSFGLA